MVSHYDHRGVPAGVVGPKRLHEGKVALAAGHEMKHDDLRRDLSGSTQPVHVGLSYEDREALAFEPGLLSRARDWLVVDE